MSFEGPLTLTHLDTHWHKWRVESELKFYVDPAHFIEVPLGFVTDGASVPRPYWWVLPAWGSYSRAAVLHDFLYAMLDVKQPVQYAHNYKLADKIFYDAMKACGTNWLARWAMYLAVRAYSSVLK